LNIKSYQPRKLSIPVTELEQASFCQLDDNLRSKTLEEEFRSGVKWQKVPNRYLKMSPAEIDSEVKRMKSIIGSKLYILGHHYQRKEVPRFLLGKFYLFHFESRFDLLIPLVNH